MKVNQLKSKGCNVYLLEKDGESFLIDTGTPSSRKMLESQIKAKIDTKTLNGIIITHAHFDHIGSAAFLQRKFDCEIYVHERDIPYLKGVKKLRFSGVFGKLTSLVERFLRVEYPEKVKPVDEVFEVFSTTEVEGANDRDLAVIHTPGHTPGSICIKAEDRLFCGDLFRGGRKVGLSPKAFCSDYSTYLNSINSISKLDFILALPGHGDAILKKEIDVLIL